MRESSWQKARNILCVRLDTVGDVLMTTPALRALKETKPDSRVTLLTSTIGAEAAALVPEIDGVIAFDAPWMKATTAHAGGEELLSLARRLRSLRFDAAVIFTVFSQSPLPAALLAFLAGVPLRLACCRENPYLLLTDWVREQEPEGGVRHEVTRQLDLVGVVGCRTSSNLLSLCIPDAARRSVRMMLGELNITSATPWVPIHPGATATSRRYPALGFAGVARRLVEECGFQVVFTGKADEEPLVESIRRAMGAPSHSLAGRLRLDQLAALMSLAPLLVSNNTGPAHIAAAVGTPVVDLYALTNPQHFPWGVPSRVLYRDVPCRYCYKSVCPHGDNRCLSGVTPDEVVDAALELLREVREAGLREKLVSHGPRRR